MKAATSGFLELPGEIRQLIYTFVFAGATIEIELPVAARNKMYQSTAPSNRCLPGILLASKNLRAETLPLFLTVATPILYLHKLTNPEVPHMFLASAKSLVVKGWESWIPGRALMPHVTHLELLDENDVVPWAAFTDILATDGQILAGVINKIKSIRTLGKSTWLDGDVQVLVTAEFRDRSLGGPFASVLIDFNNSKVIKWCGLN